MRQATFGYCHPSHPTLPHRYRDRVLDPSRFPLDPAAPQIDLSEVCVFCLIVGVAGPASLGSTTKNRGCCLHATVRPRRAQRAVRRGQEITVLLPIEDALWQMGRLRRLNWLWWLCGLRLHRGLRRGGQFLPGSRRAGVCRRKLRLIGLGCLRNLIVGIGDFFSLLALRVGLSNCVRLHKVLETHHPLLSSRSQPSRLAQAKNMVHWSGDAVSGTSTSARFSASRSSCATAEGSRDMEAM